MNNSDPTTVSATPRQTFAIFCATKYDVRNCKLSLQKASEIIALLKSGDKVVGFNMVKELPGAVCKGEAKESAPVQNFQLIYDEANKAGKEAVEALIRNEQLQPMVVTQHANPLDDKSKIEKAWYVSDGVCGFAWIEIKDGRSAFYKWLKAKGLVSDGSKNIWVHQYNQSMQKKESYAYAFSAVLNKHGIKAYAGSRMD